MISFMRLKTQSKRKRNRGTSAAETACSLVIVLPFIIVITFIAADLAQICVIKFALSECAGTAARRLAIKYGQNPDAAMLDPESAFTGIKFLNIETSPNQFSIPDGTAGWNLAGSPQTVTVKCSFEPGKYVGAILPAPLFLKSFNRNMSACATQVLEGN